MSSLRLFLLGSPRLERDGVPLEFRYRKNVALLAYLAVGGPGGSGKSHTREALITLLWPETEPDRARAGLRRNLSTLRRTLGEGWLVADRETVGLDPGAGLWVDVDRFRGLLRACREHDHPETDVCPACLAALDEAVALYRGDFLEGFTLPDSPGFDEFQFFQVEGLRGDLAWALERLARGHAAQGAYEQAIPTARRWLALDPLHEPAHRCLMTLYAQAGQRSAALRQYRECVRILEEELGLPPAEETVILYERIRTERARPPESEAISPAPTSVSPAHTLPAFLAAEEGPAPVERPVFVARERELARLDGYLDAALAGQGQVAFVTGGPGRGKTALMHEFARRAMMTQPQLLVASGNCNAYFGLGDPYLPFRGVLGMLTGDVEARWAAGTISHEHARRLWRGLGRAARALVDHGPSLIGTLVPGGPLLARAGAVAPQDAGWMQELSALAEGQRPGYSGLEQRAMFEQYTNVLRDLASQYPLLLLLDDVQWADAASIGLLLHLGRRLEGARILVACAYRPEDVAIGRAGERHPLASAVSELKRLFGDMWVDLRHVDEAGGRRFVNAFLDVEANRLEDRFREALFLHTGGHPLFTIEGLRAMQERGDLVRDEQGRWTEGPTLDWNTLPARVEAVIAERVDRLDQKLRDILAVASVEGERFTAQVVALVQDVPEREVLRALSHELQVRHRLVREEEEVETDRCFLSHYRFAHALFQQYLYEGLGGGERRLLHGEVGQALEGLYGGRTEDVAAQLAHHYAEAGQVEKAIEYALRAGDQANLAHAYAEAIAYYGRTLELLGPAPASFDELTATSTRGGRTDFPIGSKEGAWRQAALRGLGWACYWAGRLAEAEENLREAIALARQIELAPRELAWIHYYLAETLWWQGRYEDEIRVGEEGLALLGDDTESVAAALMNDVIAWGHWTTGNTQKASDILRRNEQILGCLPFSWELTILYSHIIEVFRDIDRNVEKATAWWRIVEREAPHSNYPGFREGIRGLTGYDLLLMGDLHEGTRRIQQFAEMFARIGDAKHEGLWLRLTAEAFLSLGDLENAEEYADRALETAQEVGHKRGIAICYADIGVIALCRGDWGKAVTASEKALQICTEIGMSWGVARAHNLLGQAHLAEGDREEALNRFQEALAVAGPEVWRGYISVDFLSSCADPWIVNTLSGLEAAYDDPDAFRTFCRRFREDHVEAGDAPFVQWFLEPAVVGAVRAPPLQRDDFVAALSPGWAWEDLFGDCSFAVRDGLEIHAANGRGLWHVNLSAPRLLRPVDGSWAAETVCVPVLAPASGGRPTIGGLVLWKDKDNFLRLDRGASGEGDVFFGGYLENRCLVIGRGRLPLDPSRRVFLRLERVGDRVDGFCSADGEDWFTVGYIAFPVADPLQVGVHAIGDIDRTVYHGAYPDGTAICFESFLLWAYDAGGPK